jgi:hypothetical protein
MSESLCEDCPPVGYPTDETRCTPCPRRFALTDLRWHTCTAADPWRSEMGKRGAHPDAVDFGEREMRCPHCMAEWTHEDKSS